MSTAKHTLGPWTFGHFGRDQLWVGQSYDSLPVATVAWDCADARENSRDNARLIAAAPDLLAACRIALREMNARIDFASENCEAAPVFVGIADIRAAIAKAEGPLFAEERGTE